MEKYVPQEDHSITSLTILSAISNAFFLQYKTRKSNWIVSEEYILKLQ